MTTANARGMRTLLGLAALFFVSSLGLTYLGSMHTTPKDVMQQGVMSDVPVTKSTDVPSTAVPAPAVPPATAPAGEKAPAGAPSKAGEVPK